MIANLRTNASGALVRSAPPLQLGTLCARPRGSLILGAGLACFRTALCALKIGCVLLLSKCSGAYAHALAAGRTARHRPHASRRCIGRQLVRDMIKSSKTAVCTPSVRALSSVQAHVIAEKRRPRNPSMVARRAHQQKPEVAAVQRRQVYRSVRLLGLPTMTPLAPSGAVAAASVNLSSRYLLAAQAVLPWA